MPCTVGVELNCLKNIGTELILPFLNHTTERSCLETWLSLHWIKLFQQTLYHCDKPSYVQIVNVYKKFYSLLMNTLGFGFARGKRMQR